MILAFDVDDTLILPPEATGLDRDTPNYNVITIYRFFQAQGERMIVWSGGGESYAKSWGEKLGLNADEYRMKAQDKSIDICFDDCIVDLAKVNVRIARHNNQITRTLPKDRRQLQTKKEI